jgi:lipoate-protein ligase A
MNPTQTSVSSFFFTFLLDNKMKPLKILKLKQFPILKQLQIEEFLLKTENKNNWIVINEGTSTNSIVMGLTGKPEKLLNLENIKIDKIPVIKRYTGGGTVFVDHQTFFVSFICETNVLGESKPFPKEIMKWSELFYQNVFKNEKFSLTEDDFTFEKKKFGGNAQYITGGKLKKFVHHTSFLFDMDIEKIMKYLLIPEKKPKYREQKHHDEFLTTLNKFDFKSMGEITNSIEKSAMDNFSNVSIHSLNDFEENYFHQENYSTKVVDLK